VCDDVVEEEGQVVEEGLAPAEGRDGGGGSASELEQVVGCGGVGEDAAASVEGRVSEGWRDGVPVLADRGAVLCGRSGASERVRGGEAGAVRGSAAG
jgi:hypothetical protein